MEGVNNLRILFGTSITLGVIFLVQVGGQITLVGPEKEAVAEKHFFRLPSLSVFYAKFEVYPKVLPGSALYISRTGNQHMGLINFLDGQYVAVINRGSSKSITEPVPAVRKWVRIVMYITRFGAVNKAGLFIDGEEKWNKGITLLAKYTDVNVVFGKNSRSIILNADIKNAYFFGPQRLFFPDTNNEIGKKATARVATEFNTTGHDYYEIFGVDDVTDPWSGSNDVVVMSSRNEVLAQDVVFEDLFNEQGMRIGVRHQLFEKSEIKQQMYDLDFLVGDVTTAFASVAYVHVNPEYEFVDVSSVLVKKREKKTCKPRLHIKWAVSRSRSNSALTVAMAPDTDYESAEKLCNADIEDVSFTFHHKEEEVTATYVTRKESNCIPVKSFKIKQSYVRVTFSNLVIGGKICFDIYYDVSPEHHISKVISIYTEARYTDVENNIVTKRVVKKVYYSHLQEFRGYYVKNMDHDCCLSKKPDDTIECSPNSNNCMAIKESSSTFVTDHGCFTAVGVSVKLQPCVTEEVKAEQAMQWDGTDIMFTSLKKFAHIKGSDKLDLGLAPVKSVNRYRRFPIHHPLIPPIQCYERDTAFNGNSLKIIPRIESWEHCSHLCRAQRKCIMWRWHGAKVENKGEMCYLQDTREKSDGQYKYFIKGIYSGKRACAGKEIGGILGIDDLPDVSVLKLNNKLYFCTYVPNSEKSRCYKHEMDRVVVSRVPSSIVYVLGGNQYSNTLYGKDAQGQLIKFRTKDMSYSILSKKMLVKEMAPGKGFVASKSYDRNKLLDGSLKDEFVVYGVSYSITYYGIYQDDKKTHIVIWLAENECADRVATADHLALTCCDEVKSYCKTALNGFYYIRKPYGTTLIWCDFERREERFTIQNATEIQVEKNKVSHTVDELAEEFRLEFQYKWTEIINTWSNAFEFVTTDDVGVISLFMNQQQRTITHITITAARRTASIYEAKKENCRFTMNTWNNIEISKLKVNSVYKLRLKVNGEVYAEVDAKPPHKRWYKLSFTGTTEGFAPIIPGYIRNFYVFNRY